jgi:lysylphosphatidylglycerol synthetase-like protein (DUF2156 family)
MLRRKSSQSKGKRRYVLKFSGKYLLLLLETSRFSGSLTGMGLMFLARGVKRRLNAACVLS